MKTFAGNKTLEQIEAQCKAEGIQFDDAGYKRGGDFVVIRSKADDNQSGVACYSSVTGNFFGTTPNGTKFDSMLTTHEHEPWFQQLLSFFYVEKAAA